MRPKMLRIPQLANVKIDYQWGGDDRHRDQIVLYRANCKFMISPMLFYGAGCYAGHGINATHLARQKLLGEASAARPARVLKPSSIGCRI